MKCDVPPIGWKCTRQRGHGGPCAALPEEGFVDPKKWDYRFLELAKHIATWSKDPSTQCGAVIVGPDRDIISVGYNGFARGVDDSKERYVNRPFKIACVVHAEENAILFADRNRLKGATLYTVPFASCSKCAGLVIQAGIKRCVAPPLPADKAERWAESMKITEMMFAEAGVTVSLLNL
jgi:dCMP deaminase